MAAILGARSVRFALLGVALASIGCAADARVTRVMDGRTVNGPFIYPDAYSSFLEGVIAFEGEKYDVAVSAFRVSLNAFDADPNVWAYLARAVCAAKKGDGAREIRNARSIDDTFAGASFAEAYCAARTENREKQSAALVRARSESPRAPVPASSFANNEDSARVLAATLFRSEERGAWRALVEWSAARGDVGLEVRAWKEWIARDGAAFEPASARVHALLAKGDGITSRAIARAMIESDTRANGRDELIGKLAVDSALIAGAEASEVQKVAIRGKVLPEEIAVRALALGESETARKIVEARVAAGDDSPTLAWLTLFFGETKRVEAKGGAARAPESQLLRAMIAARMARVSPAVAREWIASLGGMPPSDDPLVERERRAFEPRVQ